MQIAPFSPVGDSATVAADTTNKTQQMTGSPTLLTVPLVLRVVNEGTTPALIAMGGSGVNALTDTQAMSVMPGERVFTWKPGATYVGVAMRSGSANVQFQLGYGV